MSILDSPNLPDPATVSNNSLALRYGGIMAGAGALLTLVGFLTNTDASMPSTSTTIKIVYGLLSFGVTIGGIIIAIREDRDKQLGGFIGLGRCVGLGAKIGAVSGVLSAIFTILYTQVINPGYTESMKNAALEQYEKSGMSEEQIEMTMSIASKFMNPVAIGISAVVMSIIACVVISLIAGAFMKRDPMEVRK